MKVEGFNSPCHDLLNYNGSSARYFNQVILREKGIKNISAIYLSWARSDGSLDPATVRAGRLIIGEGELQDNVFLDPNPTATPNDYSSWPGISRILFDTLFSGPGLHQIEFPAGFKTRKDATITVIQSPAYVSGDTNHQPSTTRATLVVVGETEYLDGAASAPWNRLR